MIVKDIGYDTEPEHSSVFFSSPSLSPWLNITFIVKWMYSNYFSNKHHCHRILQAVNVEEVWVEEKKKYAMSL